MFIASAWLRFAILKKGLLFDKINLETAKILLLYLTYKELRQNDLYNLQFFVDNLSYTLPLKN